jgi:dTDP-4-dehydrorhamnose 3,5-epimerase
MQFQAIKLPNAYIIDLDKIDDERGFFARAFCQREFAEQGLTTQFVQCNISSNRKRGTLRGMHYQLPPSAETKLVRCIRGAIYDVIVDLRPDSPTFLQWYGVELSAENRRMLYVPEGFAHGFQTLADDTELFYQMSEYYAPDYARGLRWNDPLINIAWPLAIESISAKDQAYVDCAPEDFQALPTVTAIR